MGSRSSSGPSSSRYSGAVDCRKIALAAVVMRLASTKKIMVAAYAAATGTMDHVQRRRASGSTATSTSAAIPERKLATCQALSVMALMAAPPVENSRAALTSRSRLRTGEDSIRYRKRAARTGAPPFHGFWARISAAMSAALARAVCM